jgi:A/G-specific adenine glycosylase
MLQQTQVATVRDYYERWMARFPTVGALATANEADVLHAWQGLGYYSRARNLWHGAREVVERHAGRVPRRAAELRALPGIGPYSAGAIASIAFGERAPIVDGNVVRVLCRLFALRGDPARAPLRGALWQIAAALVPEGAAADFNQALMELGATVCLPRAPRCTDCPVARSCKARRDGIAERFPQTAPRRPIEAVRRVAALVWRRGRVLAVRVPANAPRWANLWEFPNVEIAARESAGHAARRAVAIAVGLAVEPGELFATVRHSVTHHRITLEAYRCEALRGTLRARGCGAFRWMAPPELESLAMPAAHRKIARTIQVTACRPAES